MTVRIEIERLGVWAPAPGDAVGWSRRGARAQVVALVGAGAVLPGDARLVDEDTGVIVDGAAIGEIAEELAAGRDGSRCWFQPEGG